MDMLQFHGHETSKYCERFRGYKIIKAFRIKKNIYPNKIKKYKTFAYLFDTFVPYKVGGTGKVFRWNTLSNLSGFKQRLFLSGGLNEENIYKAIKIVRPHWVDVSSSLEIKPGRKNHRMIKRFIRKAKSQE